MTSLDLSQTPQGRPLRVGLLIAHFHPNASGAEVQALRQAEELVRRGVSVEVLTSRVPGYPPVETWHGFRIHRRIQTMSLGPFFGMSFVVSAVRELIRLHKHVDLIHTHQAMWESVSAGLAHKLMPGLPTLVQPASAGYYGEAEELSRTKGFSTLRRLALANTAFASISEEIHRQWLALGVEPKRIYRTASGVDTSQFHPGQATESVEAQLPPRPRVIFTGRLHPQKNLDLILDAWPEVVARTRASLILVGQGPERERLTERCRVLQVAEHVHFAGAVPDPSEHLRSADVFVLPSVAEGMSNSLLEAMATGLPCLASNIGGNTDLLGDGAGLLVEPEPHAWSETVIRVLTDRDWAKWISQEARRRVERTYSIAAVIQRNLQIYRALLDSQSPLRTGESLVKYDPD